MKLLSRRTRRDAAEFSREFYDCYLFGHDSLGVDLISTYAETTHRLISEADPSFSLVGIPKLTEELLGLQLEMIGTAWTHASNTEVALKNSQFTKDYLSDIARSDLWEMMGEYNRVVANSVTYGTDPKSRFGAARRVFVDSMRINLMKNLTTKGHDVQPTVRVVNRFDSETNWKKGIAQPLLAIQLMRRVEFECTEAVAHSLGAVAFGFYQGAKEALEGVRLTA